MTFDEWWAQYGPAEHVAGKPEIMAFARAAWVFAVVQTENAAVERCAAACDGLAARTAPDSVACAAFRRAAAEIRGGAS